MRRVHQIKDRERSLRLQSKPLTTGGHSDQSTFSVTNLELAPDTPIGGDLIHSHYDSVGSLAASATHSQILESPNHYASPNRGNTSAVFNMNQSMQSARNKSEPLIQSTVLPYAAAMTLGGLEQRLVVPGTISPTAFTLNLSDMEKIRHCELISKLNKPHTFAAGFDS
jgi:hypothetical protein